MQKKRGERLADLERRRTNPVLLQQEREFNQLIEIHAALGRLHLKTEQTQARREDVRYFHVSFSRVMPSATVLTCHGLFRSARGCWSPGI